MVELDIVTTRVQRWWLAVGVLLLALIVWGSLAPSVPDLGVPIPQFDKIEHICAYLLLTTWFSAAYPKRWLWIAVGFAVFGGLIEILQGYTGRDPDWFDWFADCIGAGLGAWYPRHWALRLRGLITDRYGRGRA
ncbi:MAG TPA: VanZ family protein [Gammaproteobacteria bacterium]|nr:VanZ family protein [Gammaproteobacteria bacterium]